MHLSDADKFWGNTLRAIALHYIVPGGPGYEFLILSYKGKKVIEGFQVPRKHNPVYILERKKSLYLQGEERMVHKEASVGAGRSIRRSIVI